MKTVTPASNRHYSFQIANRNNLIQSLLNSLSWKTSAMVHVLKTMSSGMKGGTSFMEDYTYHFNPANPMVLGSHMLEICPTITDGLVKCEVHPLGIGAKEDPVRLVFNGQEGPSINVSLVDMGNRFRLIVNEVDAVKVTEEFPKLPTARALSSTRTAASILPRTSAASSSRCRTGIRSTTLSRKK